MNASYPAGGAIKVFFEKVTLWDDPRVKSSSDKEVEKSILGSRVSRLQSPGVRRESNLFKKL